MGLSHPFDAGDDQSNGDDALPLSKDSMRNTVMTYVQLDKNFVMQFDGGGTSAPSYRIYAVIYCTECACSDLFAHATMYLQSTCPLPRFDMSALTR